MNGALDPGAFCHCESCRRSSGSAFQVNAATREDAVHFESGRDGIREYESSPGKFRAFCGACGSPIYARQTAVAGVLSLRMGLIDEDPGQRPRAHFNVGEKAPWYEITDDHPQYADDTEDHPIK